MNTQEKLLSKLKRYLTDYYTQIEKAKTEIETLENTSPKSDEFAQALADIHVCATVLSPYSEGLLKAIDQFTEENPD